MKENSLAGIERIISCKTEMINFLLNDLKQRPEFLDQEVQEAYRKKIEELRDQIISLKIKRIFS